MYNTFGIVQYYTTQSTKIPIIQNHSYAPLSAWKLDDREKSVTTLDTPYIIIHVKNCTKIHYVKMF